MARNARSRLAKGGSWQETISSDIAAPAGAKGLLGAPLQLLDAVLFPQGPAAVAKLHRLEIRLKHNDPRLRAVLQWRPGKEAHARSGPGPDSSSPAGDA